jgi:two-component system response regulator PilR (NtrC family)
VSVEALSLLLIEDKEGGAKLMTRRLEALGCSVCVVNKLSDAKLAIANQEWTIAVLDLRLPDGNCLDLVPLLHFSHTIIVCVTGDENTKTVFMLSHEVHASDFTREDFGYPDSVYAVVKTVVGANRTGAYSKSKVVPLRDEGSTATASLLGHSAAICRLRSEIANVGRFDVSVLITGETGTGKELIAKAIHASSDRSCKPFVALNCAAMTSELFESELFGHEKGAFTSATKHEGLFAQADGGTLFLDEIGDLDLRAQAKLLRVLNDGTYRPVGSRTELRSDARIVSATNVDIPEAVAGGRFRSDLAFRLEKIRIQTAALREMTSDIPALAESIVSRFDRKFFEGCAPHQISECAMEELCTHTWPGNVRELENVIERQLIQRTENPIVSFGLEPKGDSQEARDVRLRVLLQRHAGDTGAVARALEVDRRTVQRYAKNAGIKARSYSC